MSPQSRAFGALLSLALSRSLSLPQALPQALSLSLPLAGLLFADAPSAQGSAQPAQDPGTSYLYHVPLLGQPQAFLQLRRLGHAECCSVQNAGTQTAYVEVVVAPEEHAGFQRLGYRSRLVARGRPYREIRARLRKGSTTMAIDPGYFTLAEVEAELLSLQTAFPKLARRVDITALTRSPKTHEGRSLFAIKISDNVAVQEDEPRILIASQHHARELNSTFMSIGTARRLLSGYAKDQAIRAIVDANEVWIVPTVNPDGVNHVWSKDNMWRKNRRKNSSSSYGVDLNRNYPFEWGKCGSTSSRTTSNTYRGPSPASEPEVQTMMALARLLRFEKYMDFHSSGREVLTTFNPCTHKLYQNGPFGRMEATHRNTLMKAMNFKTRTPSASGEAMEWHYAENGSLSYLVEVGTSFQPAFKDTVAEEARVWPGVLAFLQIRPSFRGHVTSLKGQAPLGVELVAKVLALRNGEKTRGQSDTGRYHLWLPPGKSAVTFRAGSHDPTAPTLTAPAYGTTHKHDQVLIPTLPVATVTGPAQVKLNSKGVLTFRAQDPGTVYWVAISLGTSPGVAVGPRHLDMNPDAIFFNSSLPMAPVYSNQVGVLDSKGEAQAVIQLPRNPVFHNLRLFFAGITFETGWPFEVKNFSKPHSIRFVN